MGGWPWEQIDGTGMSGVKFKINIAECHLLMTTAREIGHKLSNSDALLMIFMVQLQAIFINANVRKFYGTLEMFGNKCSLRISLDGWNLKKS